jgi:hypothetical protein
MAANGNPGEIVQRIPAGGGTPDGGYLANRGWTSMTTYGLESGMFVLLHDFVNQEAWVYAIGTDGKLGHQVDEGDWPFGWTGVDAIQAPGKVLLYGVRS